jgi:hypothetical protein
MIVTYGGLAEPESARDCQYQLLSMVLGGSNRISRDSAGQRGERGGVRKGAERESE